MFWGEVHIVCGASDPHYSMRWVSPLLFTLGTPSFQLFPSPLHQTGFGVRREEGLHPLLCFKVTASPCFPGLGGCGDEGRNQVWEPAGSPHLLQGPPTHPGQPAHHPSGECLSSGGLCSTPDLETPSPPPPKVSLKSFPLAGLQFLHQS